MKKWEATEVREVRPIGIEKPEIPDHFKDRVRKCLGCGYCCMKSMCVMGQLESGLPGNKPCPYLKWNGEMYRCELVNWGADVGQGWGCCSNLNSWRKNVKFRGFKKEKYHVGTRSRRTTERG